ncbi:MAG: FAD-dependent oxidoreductase, partial [Elusimicrobia bacterium]|nr:FAD-dependent oxidoreductase [Elusimicrobiota bacterium]
MAIASEKQTEVLVVGAGPGGYVAAIKLGKLGKKVLLVDRDALGGECLNYGCIPSKAMISTAHLLHKARKAKDIGFSSENLSVDWAQVQKWRGGLIGGFQRAVASLTKGNSGQVLMGEARFTGPDTAEVRGAGGIEAIRFQHAIVATGSKALEIPGFPFDGNAVLSNKEALELAEIPRRLLVIGGGVIGLEIGTLYAKLGSKVTVVELLPQILTGIDPELASPVSRSLARLGVQVRLNAKASGFK